MNKLKIIWNIISLVKSWPRVFLVKFGIIKRAEICFRNGYIFTLEPQGFGNLTGLIGFFRDFPEGKVEKNGTVRFRYREKDIVFSFGSVGVHSFERIEWGDFFKDEDIKEKTVIDFGCSIGDTPIWFGTRGAKRVIGFEMLPYRHNLALRNVSLNKLDEVCQVKNEAVGGRRGKITVNTKQEHSEHYSQLDDLAKRGPRTVEIPVVTLADIVKDYEVEDGSIIKSDIQGGEYEVFMSAPDSILKKFDLIVIRFYYQRDSRAEKLQKRFESVGFQCKFIKPKKWGCGYLIARNSYFRVKSDF